MSTFSIIVIDDTELSVQVEHDEFRMSFQNRNVHHTLPSLWMTREQLMTVHDQLTKLLGLTI